ncbi:hypothetical protein [Hyphococcus sp.]|uniref:hypothetical protein n=1 Tax=Hyphococcus sp. TaxID=2038636 RepID=UPI0035C6A1B9
MFKDALMLAPKFQKLTEWPRRESYYVGVDLAKSVDRTCLTTIHKREWKTLKGWKSSYTVTNITQFPPKLEYLEQAKRISEYLDKDTFRDVKVHACVDASGVGAPVAEILRDEFGLKFRPIVITSGDGKKNNRYSRNWLITNLAIWLRKPNFKVPMDLEEAGALRREVEAIEEVESQSGTIIYKVNTPHDDRLMSLCLALLGCTRSEAFSSGVTDIFFSHLRLT